MTLTVSRRMHTARNYLKDASAPHHLLPQSRFEFAIDAAYIAALEVAVRAGYVLHPGDADNHPLEGAVRVALSVLQLSSSDKQCWPRYMHYLRNRFFQPLQSPPAPFADVQAWSERVLAAAEHWLAVRH